MVKHNIKENIFFPKIWGNPKHQIVFFLFWFTLKQFFGFVLFTTTGTCTSDRGVPEIKGFSGRSWSSGRTVVGGARVVSGAEKKII